MGLDTVEMVMAIEEHFDIEIPDEVVETLVTVGSLHACVVSLLAQRADGPVDADAVLLEVRKIVADQLGIELDRVVPEARFVEDLKVDTC